MNASPSNPQSAPSPPADRDARRSSKEARRVDPGEPPKKRAAWRQQLVEAERGMTLGFRGDSGLFVHFFVASIVIAIAGVLGVSWIEWSVIALALTLTLSAEMFHRVLDTIWKRVGHHLGEETRHAQRIGTAAVFVTTIGATITVALILAPRLIALAH